MSGKIVRLSSIFLIHLGPQTFFFKKRRIQGGCHCSLSILPIVFFFCVFLHGFIWEGELLGETICLDNQWFWANKGL